MGKLIIFGVIVYLVIGLIFLRQTITSMARQKRKDPNYKNAYPGCTMLFAVFFWPLVPIILLVIGGIMKDMKKLKKEIEGTENLLKDEQETVKTYESILRDDPSRAILFEDNLRQSRRKCAKWEEDLKKLKAQYEKGKH
jgi:hypothetical protein